MLATPTWRANLDWGAKLGYEAPALDRINRTAVAFLRELGYLVDEGDDFTIDTSGVDPEIASVGIPTGRVTDEDSPTQIESVTLQFSSNPRAKMAEHTEGFVKLHARRGSGTVLGGVVVADSASDLITPLSVAVRNRLTVEQLAHAFTIYPSMAGSIQETARLTMGRQPDDVVY